MILLEKAQNMLTTVDQLVGVSVAGFYHLDLKCPINAAIILQLPTLHYCNFPPGTWSDIYRCFVALFKLKVYKNLLRSLYMTGDVFVGLTLLPQLCWRSWLFLVLSNTWAGLGITAGAHRLWAHRTYKVGEFRIEGFSQF